MSRPTKFRKIEFFPKNTHFVPVGKSKCQLQEMHLKIEELEAIRLKDIEGLKQEECADKMMVSRQTFQNIIDSARKKIAIALIEGNEIKIGGGNFTTEYCKFICSGCDTTYEIKYENDKKTCPLCGSEKVECSRKMDKCRKWCR